MRKLEKSSDRAQTQGLSQQSCQLSRQMVRAQGRQSGHQHQGQVKAAGELPRRPGQQDTQGEGQAHENEVGQQIIPAVKDGPRYGPSREARPEG